MGLCARAHSAHNLMLEHLLEGTRTVARRKAGAAMVVRYPTYRQRRRYFGDHLSLRRRQVEVVRALQ